MIQLPANLAQRILEAARIAAAIHREQDTAQERAPQAERLEDAETLSE